MTDRKSKDPGEYQVGYRKPPKQHQFKKGQSGNPRGRPKGMGNVANIVNDILTTPTSISVNGKTHTIPAYAATIAATLQKAMTGDSRAAGKILELAQRYAPDVINTEVNAEVERLIFEHVRAREDRFRELMNRMSPEQKRRYRRCMDEMEEIHKACDVDAYFHPFESTGIKEPPTSSD